MAHVKLQAFELQSLTIHRSDPPSFSRPLSRSSISHAEILGIVSSVESKPKFVKFLIDDGTGCMPCILWLNHPRVPSTSYQNVMVEFTACDAQTVKLGEQLRVRGRITVYRDEIQLTVRDVLVEIDPNMETFHRLDCIRNALQFIPCDSPGKD